MRNGDDDNCYYASRQLFQSAIFNYFHTICRRQRQSDEHMPNWENLSFWPFARSQNRQKNGKNYIKKLHILKSSCNGRTYDTYKTANIWDK